MILNTLTNPRSVAVIGASRDSQKVGHQIFQNLKSSFTGKLYPVNPNATTIAGLKAYPTISQIPHPIDMAVIATPTQLVIPIVDECIHHKVPVAIIITAGFAESGIKGIRLQSELSTRVGKIRLLGPNCLGVISPSNALNASFGPRQTIAGDITLISQSGAMITGVLDWSTQRQIGIAHAISLGNRIDISENDALEFALHDPKSRTILVYIESFKDAPAFFSLASRVTPHKPVILLKGGASKVGQQASASHTASLATSQALIDAFARQTGVIMTSNIKDWLNQAALFHQTKPIRGLDLAIITNAGGPGVVTADEAATSSLKIHPFDAKTAKSLTNHLSHSAQSNPLDIRGDATPQDFQKAISILMNDSYADTLMLIVTPQTTTQPSVLADTIISQARNSSKPIIVICIGGSQLLVTKTKLAKAGIPVFDFPQDAVSILANKAKYDTSKNSISPHPAQITISPAPKISPTNLTITSAFSALKDVGFTLPRFCTISQVSDVPQALATVGRPAVLKTASMSVSHKALVGGVITSIMTTDQARLAFRKLSRIYQEVLFQQTIAYVFEVLIGARRDPVMGPFMTIGFGGSLTNIIADRQYIALPATKKVLQKTFQQTKIYSHLTTEMKQQTLIAMQQFQQFFLSHQEFQESEINPLVLTSKQAYVLDIKISLSNPANKAPIDAQNQPG